MAAELFELKPEEVRYMTTVDGKRVRAWVKLTRGGLPAEASAERDDPLSAVTAAVELALTEWFHTGYITIITYPRIVYHPPLYAVFCYARAGDCCKEGVTNHGDVVKATALACIAAINDVLAVAEVASTPTA